MPRYRVSVTMVYDIETNLAQNEAKALVEDDIKDCLAHKSLRSKHLRLERLKDVRRNTQLGEFAIEDVLPYVAEDVKREYQVGDETYSVRMGSHRYFVFRENLKCVACGLEGKKMILELSPGDKSPHFNLYAEENGKLILMTKDHVQPKAYGGEDKISNYQCCCLICNNLKGSHNITIDGMRELRQIYDSNRSLSKKELGKLLNEARKRLERPHTKIKIPSQRKHLAACKSQETLKLNTDIYIWRKDGALVGRSVFDNLLADGELVAGIAQDTECECLGFFEDKLSIKFSDTESFLIYQGYLDVDETRKV